MTRIGDTTTDLLPPCAGAEGCTQPIVVVILTRADWCSWGDHVDHTTACAGHAPEVIHEIRASMDESEYVVIVKGVKADLDTTGLRDRASKDASLGVGHIWTNTRCSAYTSLNPTDCTCREAP